MKMLADDTISSKQAKEVFAAIMDEGADPRPSWSARGMKQVSDTGAIEAVVDEVIAANPDEVARYRDGNTQGYRFFVGQCMKRHARPGQPQDHQRAARQETGVGKRSRQFVFKWQPPPKVRPFVKKDAEFSNLISFLLQSPVQNPIIEQMFLRFHER